MTPEEGVKLLFTTLAWCGVAVAAVVLVLKRLWP